MNQKIADFLVRHRLLCFCASIIFIGVSCLGFAKIHYVSDYKIFFAPDDPNLAAFEDLENTFSKVESVIFFVSPKNKDMFSSEGLKSIVWLTSQSWQLPYSMRVDSLSNFQHTRAVGDELIVEDLISADFDGSREIRERIRTIAMNEPLLFKQVVTPAGDGSIISITLALPPDPTVALPELMKGPKGVEELVSNFKSRFPGIDIHVAGVASFNYYMSVVATEDFAKLVPGLLLVVLVLVGILTRSVSNTVVTLLVIMVSVVSTVGFVCLVGISLDNISAMAPMIIMTLAVAESVHLLSYYSRTLREGSSKTEAMVESLSTNLRPVFLTSFTTAIGFLGMCTIDSPPFIKFGFIAAFGIIIAYLFAHTMLPQLAIWFSRAHAGAPEVHEDRFHGAAAEWVIANPKKVFYGTLGFSIALSGCVFLNELNDDSVGYFGKTVPIRVATEAAESHGLGMNFIEYKFETDEDYGIADPAYLKKVEAFVNWYRKQPEVIHVSSFTDVLKRLNKNMHDDDPAFYRLPESRELTSQYLLMYEISLPQGMDLNNQISTRKSALRITVNTPMLKARQNLALEARAQTWLESNAPELRIPGASPTIMFSHIGQSNVQSIMWGTFSSIAIICLCMIFGFGSIQLGLLALLPNVFPSAIALGIWGLVVGEVNMGVAVIFTITSGIIVDDTIHLFTKFGSGLRSGLNVDDAIRYTFEHAGKGVLITTVVLCAGFAMLLFSDFVVNRTLGIMVSGTIAIAIVFDLLFLPSVLKVFPINVNAFNKK